jgi:dTDP-4-dehydrorhamnose 3,5-epimerase
MMKLQKTSLDGVFEILTETFSDKRGLFYRAYDDEDLSSILAGRQIKQLNVSDNLKKGTIRGMHSQTGIASELKIIRCLTGAIFDVVVDMRRDSPTYLKSISFELDSHEKRAVLIPEGFAHGFQTLKRNTKLLYAHTNTYRPEYESCYRFDDPMLNITWPLKPKNVSTKDLSYPLIGNSLEKH